MGLPLVSIIIPCYNSERFLSAAIESALGQSYPNCEVIVVDDGSVDKSLNVAGSFKSKIALIESRHLGAPAARNIGLNVSKGEYIKYLDADDRLHEDCIRLQMEQYLDKSLSDAAVLYGDTILIDENGLRIGEYKYKGCASGEDKVAHILSNNFLTSCPLHKRQYLEQVGGFAENLNRGQEYDLHMRLVLHGINFIHQDIVAYYHRVHESPDKISVNAIGKYGPMDAHNRYLRISHLIESKNLLTKRAENSLSYYFWANGRAVYREGYIKEANTYFQTARKLKHSILMVHGVYLQLARIFGCKLTESLFLIFGESMRSIRKQIK